MSARAVLATVVAAAAAGTAAADAAAPLRVIQGDRAVGGLRIADATLADARARFGAPTATRREPPYGCVATWRALGLTLLFLELSDRNPCAAGVMLRATVTSRGAWRTSKGLRKGDSIARLRLLYPRAAHRSGFGPWTGYWLVTRRSCELGGFQPYPGLLARVRNGRVAALIAGTVACE
ncbi:MAG TPA: hypothetical protein VFO81_07355 [Gaiellaceae bacterium]|nr:hypothetical protein [Gaiellaceae bacterium]